MFLFQYWEGQVAGVMFVQHSSYQQLSSQEISSVQLPLPFWKLLNQSSQTHSPPFWLHQPLETREQEGLHPLSVEFVFLGPPGVLRSLRLYQLRHCLAW